MALLKANQTHLKGGSLDEGEMEKKKSLEYTKDFV